MVTVGDELYVVGGNGLLGGVGTIERFAVGRNEWQVVGELEGSRWGTFRALEWLLRYF